MKIINVCGARPNFMKIAALAQAFRQRPAIETLLVHTGQHYDERMSRLFFDELEIPTPDINLEVGSGSHAAQTAEIMKRFETVCLTHNPTHVLVVGDVNSTIACALVAAKLGIKVIHVEAGLRSFDSTMPEEINRVLTDRISDLLFVSEESGVVNLQREGVAPDRVHFVGNVMIDTLIKHRGKAERSRILSQLGIEGATGSSAPAPYAVATLHRPANVDSDVVLARILGALKAVGKDMPVVFPVHPRTRERLAACDPGRELTWVDLKAAAHPAVTRGVMVTEALGYLDFLKLVANARLVITDSGGVQEETTILKVPCVTLRENTERPVTITHGTNRLLGTDQEEIIVGCRAALATDYSALADPPLWDGGAAVRIVDILAGSASAARRV